MKKVLSAILTLVICLSLCACGGENNKENGESVSVQEELLAPTQEELLKSVKTFSLTKFREDCNDNLLRAKDTYIGKVYKISGFVKEIKEDCCVFDSSVVVPLSKDTLMSLSVGDCITVIGRVGDVAHEEETRQVGIGTNTTIYNILTMDVAYYLGNANNFSAEVIYLATNGGLLKLLDDFDGRYCGVEVSLTKDEVDQFQYGDVINVEGIIIKSANSQTYAFNGKQYNAYLNIDGATIEKP